MANRCFIFMFFVDVDILKKKRERIFIAIGWRQLSLEQGARQANADAVV